MTAPFQLPVSWTGILDNVLVTADAELIGEIESASFLERAFIARAINKHDALVAALEDMLDSAPALWECSERARDLLDTL